MPILNVPPGWPAPPAGWTPPAGWQPDPSWPPAPVDHVWWIEDAATASSAAAFGAPSLVPDNGADTAAERVARRSAPQREMAGAPARREVRTASGSFAVPSLVPDDDPVQPMTVAAPLPAPAPVPGSAVSSADPPRSQADALLAYATAAQEEPEDDMPVPVLGARPPVVAAPAAFTAPLVDPVALIAELERQAGRKAMAIGVVLLVLGLGAAAAGYVVTVPVAVFAALGLLTLLGLVQLIRGGLVRSRAQESALRRVLNP